MRRSLIATPPAGVNAAGPRLTLLVRAYCHLCDDMRDALLPLARERGAAIAEIDVDADPALELRYGDRVPVLLLGTPDGGRELCHYVLDAARLTSALEGEAGR
ncbi:MAG: glutaredoxin family protein [Betaproteobacteria bacterium]|nr:glutaredoxin family protein [Betaproteobacteria bacterium]MDE2003555.1 glutaredoxin family protein [Betaproteobacteria bacterium]MDE2209092.1 glutaredoxin family protein [Betaproteobacteria bacterium]MDE2359720.1 glutaredoxin family protein [Betaproteobacteria bacterium]